MELISKVYRKIELATAALRGLPDFLIIGAQKAGTTSLYSFLKGHPQVSMPRVKEIHFFDNQFEKGPDFYRSHFPMRRNGVITGEASPYYLFHPLTPGRVQKICPTVKIIAILRDPVERAISQYKHNIRLGYETLPFDEALRSEQQRLAGEEERLARGEIAFSFPHRYYSYVSRGRYARQLARWKAVFPEEQILILDFDDLHRKPGAIGKQITEFLGIRQFNLSLMPEKNKSEKTLAVDRNFVASFFTEAELNYRSLFRS